jgi:hypothetical protein
MQLRWGCHASFGIVTQAVQLVQQAVRVGSGALLLARLLLWRRRLCYEHCGLAICQG